MRYTFGAIGDVADPNEDLIQEHRFDGGQIFLKCVHASSQCFKNEVQVAVRQADA